MSEMVERVARVLQRQHHNCDASAAAEWGKDSEDDCYQNAYRSDARAAIAAMREPTDGMLKVCEGMDLHIAQTPSYGEAYTAMIDAALSSEISE
jgi:hypothetical protein